MHTFQKKRTTPTGIILIGILVIIGFLIALTNNFDAFLDGFKSMF